MFKKASKRIKQKSIGGRDNQWIGIVFTLPFIIGFVFIFIGLITNSLKFAFSELNMGDTGYSLKFVGWGNFYHALRVDANFLGYVWNRVSQMLISLPIIIIFSLFIAVVLDKAIPGKTAFRAIFFLPVVLSVGLISKLDSNNMVMTAMSSATIDTGMVQGSTDTLSAISSITVFLQNMEFSPGLVTFVSNMANNITDVINQSGVQILISLAAIQSIPKSVFEAASVEGATSWEMFWKITLPMVTPMMIVNVFYTLIAQLTIDTDILSRYINSQSLTLGYGIGAAMSWIFLAAVAIMLAIVILIVRRFDTYSEFAE